MDQDLLTGSTSSFKKWDQQMDHWYKEIPCIRGGAERHLRITNTDGVEQNTK